MKIKIRTLYVTTRTKKLTGNTMAYWNTCNQTCLKCTFRITGNKSIILRDLYKTFGE
jgi:hypothetical protein